LKVIPVIDILKGEAVHAVRGNRSEYQPLKSILSKTADPVAVACAFKEIGFHDLYVADLDAIMGNGENRNSIQQIKEKTGLMLLVDAGIWEKKRAKQLLQHGAKRVIVGTETLPSLDCLSDIIQYLGTEKIVVSVDLKSGKVLSKSNSVTSLNVIELACKLEKIGACEIIVLDLARVGSKEGVDLNLLKDLMNETKIKVAVGGGVRDISELKTLRNLGVHEVLLATALHSGEIRIDELRNSDFMR